MRPLAAALVLLAASTACIDKDVTAPTELVATGDLTISDADKRAEGSDTIAATLTIELDESDIPVGGTTAYVGAEGSCTGAYTEFTYTRDGSTAEFVEEGAGDLPGCTRAGGLLTFTTGEDDAGTEVRAIIVDRVSVAVDSGAVGGSVRWSGILTEAAEGR